MGRRKHPSQWAESGSPMHPKQDAREAMWESYVRYEAHKQQLSVAMAGWAMTDRDIDKWCYWFRSFVDRLPTGGRHGDQLWAHEVNFAENQLTSSGVRCLLETLTASKVIVLVLKLHHNQLTSGTGVADFIFNNQGALRELHLSHNELETPAAAEIVLAAASSRDSHGSFCYPSHAGHSAAPLWLRLEQNYVDPIALAHRTDPQFEKIRAGKVLCNVSSRACTPHCCVKHRHEPPPVHAKHLSNQRSKAASAQTSQSDERSKELLTMLQAGKRDDDDSERPLLKEAAGSASSGASGQKDAEDETGKGPAKADGVFADVLRWDDDELKWVRDVIEIPERKAEPTEETGRVKLSQEVGDKLGNRLKSLIGARVAAQRPEPPKHVETTPPKPKYSAPPAEVTPEMDSAERDVNRGVQDEEHPNRSPASRRSRHGKQPFGSEVTQVNGFMLNPQAKEFYPVVGSSQQRVTDSDFPPHLNPQAREFSPAELREQARLPAEANKRLAKSAGTPLSSSAGEETDTSASSLHPELEEKAADGSATTSSTSAPFEPVEGEPGAMEPEKNGASQEAAQSDTKNCLDEDEWSVGKAFYSAFSVFGLKR